MNLLTQLLDINFSFFNDSEYMSNALELFSLITMFLTIFFYEFNEIKEPFFRKNIQALGKCLLLTSKISAVIFIYVNYVFTFGLLGVKYKVNLTEISSITVLVLAVFTAFSFNFLSYLKSRGKIETYTKHLILSVYLLGTAFASFYFSYNGFHFLEDNLAALPQNLAVANLIFLFIFLVMLALILGHFNSAEAVKTK